MQTIFTRQVRARGAAAGPRVRAIADKIDSLDVPFDVTQSEAENHRRACEELRAKLGWTNKKGYPAMHGEYLEHIKGTIWVFASDGNKVDN